MLKNSLVILVLVFGLFIVSCQKEEEAVNRTGTEYIQKNTDIVIIQLGNEDEIDELNFTKEGMVLYLVSDMKGNEFYIFGESSDVMDYINSYNILLKKVLAPHSGHETEAEALREGKGHIGSKVKYVEPWWVLYTWQDTAKKNGENGVIIYNANAPEILDILENLSEGMMLGVFVDQNGETFFVYGTEKDVEDFFDANFLPKSAVYFHKGDADKRAATLREQGKTVKVEKYDCPPLFSNSWLVTW